MSFIYKTTCLVNGKIYIGQCNNKNVRTANAYLGSGRKIEDCIKKYGKANFTRETLKEFIECSQAALDFWEEHYIKKYDAANPTIGYNILVGTANKFGSGAPVHNPEVLAKFKNSLKNGVRNYDGKNNPNFGKNWTGKQKKLLSKKVKKLYKEGRINIMQGKVRITNGKHNTIIEKLAPMPEGYWHGLTMGINKRRKKNLYV